MKKIYYLTILVICFNVPDLYAYEVETHAKLSEQAILLSILGESESSPLNNMGLHSSLDIGVDLVEQSQIIGLYYPKFSDSKNNGVEISQLMQNGAIYEDDDIRSLQHFYDPENDRALKALGLEFLLSINKSPDWSLEDNFDITDPDQDFSYKSAVVSYFKALTAETEGEQNTNWGKTFESLGRIIHHIQDMAQPQHVRNDVHCPIVGCAAVHVLSIGTLGAYDPSYYENYTAKHIRTGVGVPSSIDIKKGYPIPEFDTAREFWASPDDKGLADFTNQNFVSKDTNFNIKNSALSTNALYDLPAPRLTRNQETLTNLLNDGGATCQELLDTGPIDLPAGADCIVEFIETSISDNKNPTYNGVNMRAASLSLYDEYLDKYNILDLQIEPEENHLVDIDEVPTLNRFNYDAAHQYLIPRAVAYSAGLINHFFKAKFEVTVDNVNKEVVFKNLSGEVMNGEFLLYVETPDTKLRSLHQTWDANGLAYNSELSATVSVSGLTQYDQKLMFIYRGNLGNESDLEYVYGYAVNVKNSRRSVLYVNHGTINNDANFEIHTSFYYNLRLLQFNSSFNVLFENNTTKYTIQNLHKGVGDCVIEAVGSWERIVQGIDTDLPFNTAVNNSFKNGGADGFLTFDDLVSLIGLSVPTVADCASAPYGYRSMAWDGGWISKFTVIPRVDLGFYKDNLAGSGNGLIFLAEHDMQILDGETCRNITTIQDIRNSWVPNSIATGDFDFTYEYPGIAQFYSDDSVGFLKNYFTDSIANNSCPLN